MAQDLDQSWFDSGTFARCIIESFSDVVIGKSLDGIVTSWNRSAAKVYGYSESEMIGQPMTRLFPPERTADEESILSRVKRGEQIVETAAVRRHKNGALINVSIQVSPIHDSSGSLIGAAHVERDMTERAHADELVRAAVESAPAVMLMVDGEGNILLANAMIEAVFGYERTELIGHKVDVLLPARLRDRHPQLRAEFMAAPSARRMGAGRELMGQRKDGTEISIEIGLTPVRTTQGITVLCAVVDITERKRAEALVRQQTEALLASEQRFHLAINGTEAGLWDWNPENDDVYLSPRFKEILGYRDDELPSDASVIRANIHPDDLPRRYQAMDAHLRDGGRYDIDYRVKTKSGEYIWVNARATALRDAADRPYRVVGWIMDISERKRIEQQLADSQQQLRMLNKRAHIMLEAERSKISREVHDVLGQNLTAIKLDLHWLKARIGDPAMPQAELDKRIVETEEIADRTTEAIQRIALDLRPGALDYLGLAAAVRDEARRFEVRSGIKVALDVPHDLHSLDESIATAAFRVLQELFTNIARHARARTIHVHLDEAGGTLSLDVVDDGVGMSPEVIERPTSLGLLGIRERIAEHGGSVDFSGAPGQGTRVSVRIPTTEKPEWNDAHG